MCLFSSLVLLGSRLAILIWWLIQPLRWQASFKTWIWPLLGAILMPWTTLTYVIVAPAGVVGFDWLWIALAVIADITSYIITSYGTRRTPVRTPGDLGERDWRNPLEPPSPMESVDGAAGWAEESRDRTNWTEPRDRLDELDFDDDRERRLSK